MFQKWIAMTVTLLGKFTKEILISVLKMGDNFVASKFCFSKLI